MYKLIKHKMSSAVRAAAALVVTTFLSACTDIAFTAINAPSYVLSDQYLKRDLAYGEKQYQKLDLYLPKDQAAAKRKLLIFLYGGGWTSGSKENYYFVADAFTAAGYAVAIPDYIKYPNGEFPTFVEDIARSIDWLSRSVRNYADIDEFILMGHSAGAHISALLLTDPKYLAAHNLSPNIIHAFVGLAGPYGFTPEEKKYRDVFGNLEDYSQMQPLNFVTGSEPIMLLLHGDGDTTVLPVNTRKFAEKVNNLGGTAETKFFDQRGHIDIMLAFSRVFRARDDTLCTVLNFLQSRSALE